MSWRAQNRSQDAKIQITRGTRSDCLIPESCGIQLYTTVFPTTPYYFISPKGPSADRRGYCQRQPDRQPSRLGRSGCQIS
jgi:hypothetical protein